MVLSSSNKWESGIFLEVEWNRNTMEIDLKRIKQSTVTEFLKKFGISTLDQLAALKPLCYNEANAGTYRRHVHTFQIKKDVRTVWNVYANIHPKEAWNTGMVSFGLQFSRSNHSINYLSDPDSGMEKDQILLLNLRLPGGLANIAVAHYVAEINEDKRVIKLCYMEGGASEGSQWITLKETAEGFTEVTHLTLYKSNSIFRDKILYPPLHTRAISEFHEIVRRKANLQG